MPHQGPGTHAGGRPGPARIRPRLAACFAVRRYRAVRAATLLSMPQLPDEIEAEIREAFYDQAHLIKEIRFFTGRTPKRLQPNSGSTINDMLGPDGYSSVSLFGAGEAEQLGREPLDEL